MGRRKGGLPEGALDEIMGGAPAVEPARVEDAKRSPQRPERPEEDTGGSPADPDGGREARKPAPRRGVKPKTSASSAEAAPWDDSGPRKNATHYLTEQVLGEVENLWLTMRVEMDVRRSKSEIVEAALRLAVEDAKANGRDSAVLKRLANN